MRVRLIAVLFVLVTGLGFGWYWNNQQDHALQASEAESKATSLPVRDVIIGDRTFITELATTEEEQATGLGNRSTLGKNSGMLFQFSPARQVSFWMKDMEFDIDIIWIRDGKIVEISRNIPRPTAGTPDTDLKIYTPADTVDYVLEVNAGESKDIQVGNGVLITEPKAL